MAVRGLLGGDHCQLRYAHFCQQLFDTLQAGAVEGGIDQLQLAHVIARTQGQHRVHKGVQALVGDIADRSRRQGLVKVRQLEPVETAVEIIHPVHSGCNPVGVFGGNLAAVRAIDLVSVILGGIVAGGDADARAAVQIPHRPAQGRGGLKAGIQPGGDAVGGQHPGRLPGKQLPLDAAVVGDGHGVAKPLALDKVGQRLGGPADGVDVHPVGPGPQDAPQAPGAEGQVAVEAVGHRLLIVLDVLQLCNQVRVLPGPVQPEAQLVFIGHGSFLPGSFWQLGPA